MLLIRLCGIMRTCWIPYQPRALSNIHSTSRAVVLSRTPENYSTARSRDRGTTQCAQESAKERGEQAGALAEARARAAAHEEKAIGQAATIHEQAEHNRSLEVTTASRCNLHCSRDLREKALPEFFVVRCVLVLGRPRPQGGSHLAGLRRRRRRH